MAGEMTEDYAATTPDAAGVQGARRAAVPVPAWQRHLEVIGAELFQRYRKRLMETGIALEIRRDFPGLPLADVLVRVHAGRCIVQAGDDFVALAAIRSGRWRRHLATRDDPDGRGRRADRLSRWLVIAGRLLFVSFCALSLLSVQPGGFGPAHLVLGLSAAGIGLYGLVGRRRARHVVAAAAGRRGRPRGVMGGQADVAASH